MTSLQTKYIPLSDAAKLTNYSQDYISLLCRRKKIKAIKIGRNWVTTKKWVEDYIDKTNGNGQNVVPVQMKMKEDEKPTLKVLKSNPSFSSSAEKISLKNNIAPIISKFILIAIIGSFVALGFIFFKLKS